jgi:transcriptional regulator with XRE-family HTH domain
MTTTAAAAVETLTAAVARRLRGQLAEHRITQRRLGELTGWSAMYISRRYTGETALDMKDLEIIHNVTGISPALLLIGHDVAQQHSLLPWKGSNLQPSGFRSLHLLPCSKRVLDR